MAQSRYMRTIWLAAAVAAGALGILLLARTAPVAHAIDKDCSDFGSQAAAQSYFLSHGGPRRDPSNLDADGDGLACETNPAPYRGLLSIRYRSGDFTGRVESVKHSCESHRTVKVLKVKDGPDRVIGSDETNTRGRYRVHHAGAHGRFYAKAPPKANCAKD